MKNMVASSYVVSAIVLAVNIPFAKKRSFAAAVSDLIVYGFLALSIPVVFFLSMIGTRSYIVDLKSFTFVFEVISFIFFAGAFVNHLKICFGTRGNFEKAKFELWIPLICILLMALPLSFLGRAIKLSVDYAPNYGRFMVDSDEYDPAVENIFFNYYNHAVESDGALYICKKERLVSDTCSIEKLDSDGNYTHVADVDEDDNGFRFDVYKGKIYYLSTTEDRPNLNFEIISKDIASGETEVIYSDVAEGVAAESDTWYMNFSVFKIKDGVLYYYIFGDNDDSIYCIDLDAETYTKELYVSDILTNNLQLTYAYLYHYRYSMQHDDYNCPAKIPRGDYSYCFSDNFDYDDEGHLISTTTLRKLTYDKYGFPLWCDLYTSKQINGSCYYDGCFYFFENDTKEISSFDISSESMSTIATVEEANPDSDYTMYIYGDHILIVSDSDYFVICI